MFQWIRSLLFLLLVVLTVLMWHPFIVLFWFFSPRAAFRFAGTGAGVLVSLLRVAGVRVKITGLENLPQNPPFVVISNHQSLFDIPLLMYALREFSPLFVAKKELGRGFPSVSFVLRNAGSALIDRSDGKQSLAEIARLGQQIKENAQVACIFPEGTRARDGKLKLFKNGGVHSLVTGAENPAVVIAVISQSWRIMQHRFWPVPGGYQVTLKFFPLPPGGSTELAQQARLAIETQQPH